MSRGLTLSHGLSSTFFQKKKNLRFSKRTRVASPPAPSRRSPAPLPSATSAPPTLSARTALCFFPGSGGDLGGGRGWGEGMVAGAAVRTSMRCVRKQHDQVEHVRLSVQEKPLRPVGPWGPCQNGRSTSSRSRSA